MIAMKKWFFTLTLFFFAAGAFAQSTHLDTIMHGGLARTYRVYVPAAYNGSQPVPLVFNLHGYTSNAWQQEIYGDFRPIADTANFILVHPDGSVQPGTADTQFWNIGLLGSSVDDVSFLEALIDTLDAQYNINRARVYSAGMSNGGYMGYLLACESGQFAAIASVTGSMTLPMYSSCNPAKPLPVMEIHGTADPTVPYNGSATSQGIEDVVSLWVTKNNCSPIPVMTNVPNTNPGDSATAEHYLYTGGIGGNTIEHFKVINGGHTWPNSILTIGVTCRDFDASKEIWRFFSQYSNPTAGIPENGATLAWNLWPNPASETLYLEVPGHSVTDVSLTDLQGRTLVQNRSGNMTSVDVHSLPPGHYVLRVSGADFTVTKPVVIQR